jgi:dipeptidyl aminopeptidase/acylaminoacyl peptidase
MQRPRPTSNRQALVRAGGAIAIALSALVAGSHVPALHAQARRPMSLMDIAELPRTSDPQLSPDGRFVTYALGHADWKANRLIYQLWRQEIGGGAPVQLTFSDSGVTSTFSRWSPDGRTILFHRDGQFLTMPADGGEPKALTKHATGVSFPTWTPDASAVYFLAADARTADERERDRLRDDVFAYDETYKQRQLWRVTVATGEEKAVTSGDSSVTSYRLSRDGTRIVAIRAPSPLQADAYRSEIWIMDATGEHARAITSNAVEEVEPELSPDNSQILFMAGANASLEPYYNQNLFVVAAAGGAPRALFPEFPHEFDRASWTSDGRTIVAVVNMGVHSEIFQIDPAARTFKQITDGRHSIPSSPAPVWSVEPSAGRIAFLFDEPTRFGDVWTMPIAGGTPTRVTGVYDDLDRRFALPRQEPFEWKGADGATVEGLLFYPADYDPSRRYPLVVQMHGGPTESDKFGSGAGLLQNYFPVLTGKGYVVLRPNYRGSAGYSNAAFRDLVGHYFNNMHLDIIAAVDALIAKGVADPECLVIMGWSAGGHLTNKLITMTDRFKAASAGAGAANWISMYAQSDARASRTVLFGGTPWQAAAPIDLYWSQSPLKDAARVKTPTLFFVGENDARVPMPQSIEMWRALKANGVPTRLMVAPREGHQWTELRHVIAKANAELEWFEKYARGRDYTPEKTP